jgi:hypothetical protein
MDVRFERIQSHLHGCLQQAGVFERRVDGAQLFESQISDKFSKKWLVMGAGVPESEAHELFSEPHKRERAIVPIQISPNGKVSLLLMMRPLASTEESALLEGGYVTDFSKDVGRVELCQGCYLRVDGLSSPVIQQVRWELDPVEGHKPPIEAWLRPWANLIGCNPGHPPSHWHVNSAPPEQVGRRQPRRVANPPELRLAIGLPNPLLLILSLANWLRQTA